MTPPLFLLILLMDSGVVLSQPGWDVSYTPSSICALKGSTVIMGCSYMYPAGYRVQRGIWSRELVRENYEPPDLSLNPRYRDRVQYYGDHPSDCRLGLSDVNEQDGGKYYFRFINTTAGGKYQGTSGVELSVTDPPKNVSVSISSSGEIIEGGSVTLTCSSDANPPVHDYTWYKVNVSSPVGSGQSYSFTLSLNSSGRFYCVAQNKYGAQSAAAVPLTINGGRSVVLYVALGVIIGAVCVRRKRRGGSADDSRSRQQVSSMRPDDTYTALDPQTRSSNDVYHTLTTVHPSRPDDTYKSGPAVHLS